jgi:short-subunit dehydrogenase
MQQLLTGGPCDIVVNNAGACVQAPYMTRDAASLREEMELNYWGAQRVTRAVLPSMLARGQGSIVNVSSLLGFVASATTCNYCGTKAALNAWTHALRGEVARHGIRVTVFVAPHTKTSAGEAAQFDGVTSLPVEYTAKELCAAIDRAPRQYAGSPVYRALLRLAGWFPVFMEQRLASSVERVLVSSSPAPLALSADAS